ncbi:bifunctional 5,10-methylenetetrahydrofolate dehydrogenase/5,10-methenyltetrahydrofolate cyclohydrolase [Candidatus Kaiserbacteria bacterium]|nr:bifunctional 5,10-methylenetetrahydrofolate dehydrogenase/5,10-methenyltetrahydrofolate cyclohydrolase [Candidatus Kaiserbacteria bacterium]USN91780.1 MAG: bifunctional 5,10-methylenetetrahydrofolate dehydrogenase/5,10-methenyltetrahydrofolate cyclohydrolase [Candidatus Nomurabacteria bacterium]
MIVEGSVIAEDILKSVAKVVAERSSVIRLSAITCAPNFETRKYLERKKKKAISVGIALNVVELPVDATTDDVVSSVLEVAKTVDGIVVQLPLPTQIDREAVLTAVPVGKDPDGFKYGKDNSACLPPVVGAIDEISHRHNVSWQGKRVVVLGQGRLVGAPVAEYARRLGVLVTILNRDSFDENVLQSADIIVSGVGQPHFIKPAMVKEGVVIFDAGTSEEKGLLAGDADPGLGSKAKLLTPVPGGIGPITIAYLLKNLVRLASQ